MNNLSQALLTENCINSACFFFSQNTQKTTEAPVTNFRSSLSNWRSRKLFGGRKTYGFSFSVLFCAFCEQINSIKLFIILAVTISFSSQWSSAQSYAPAPGNPGSTAMHRDSSAFIDWASEVTITRGYLNIQNPGLGTASYGTEADALGFPDGTAVVSLGDGGEAVLTFQSPIINGIGPDFAVFENGFEDHYMEFAFVEVSSNGIDFFRFDAVSETPADDQITNTTFSDCAYIHNLAGKYRQNYGTPFDLEELNGTIGLDVNNITHIKLIDVVGTIDPAYATYDSQGNIINDPYPTEFPSGGFDLDAIGVIHSTTESVNVLVEIKISVAPNPSSGVFVCNVEHQANYSVQDLSGRVIMSESSEEEIKFDLTDFPNGVYYLKVETKENSSMVKLMKQ